MYKTNLRKMKSFQIINMFKEVVEVIEERYMKEGISINYNINHRPR